MGANTCSVLIESPLIGGFVEGQREIISPARSDKTTDGLLATVALRIRKSPMSLIKHLRPHMKSIATSNMPEVVLNVPCDFKKMLESCPQEL
jgi:hypothetical protein